MELGTSIPDPCDLYVYLYFNIYVHNLMLIDCTIINIKHENKNINKHERDLSGQCVCVKSDQRTIKDKHLPDYFTNCYNWYTT